MTSPSKVPTATKPKVAHEGVRTLVRHAFHHLYVELTTSDTVTDKKFSPERAFANTLHSYRNAVLSFLRTLKIRNLARRYGGKPQVAPKKHVSQILSKLGHNTPEGAKLLPNLEQIIHRADRRWEERRQQQTS